MKFILAKSSNYQSHLFPKPVNASEKLTGILGSGDVTFYSQDNQAKEQIGLIVASREAP